MKLDILKGRMPERRKPDNKLVNLLVKLSVKVWEGIGKSVDESFDESVDTCAMGWPGISATNEQHKIKAVPCIFVTLIRTDNM